MDIQFDVFEGALLFIGQCQTFIQICHSDK